MKFEVGKLKKSAVLGLGLGLSCVTSSSLLKRDVTTYKQCVDSSVENFENFIKEAMSAWNNVADTYLCKDEDSIYGQRYSEILNKYPTLSGKKWDIEDCFKDYVCTGKYPNSTLTEMNVNGYACKTGGYGGYNYIMEVPYGVPVLPGVHTLNDMLGSAVVRELETTCKWADVRGSFINDCIKPEIEKHCLDEEKEIDERKKQEESKKEIERTKNIILGITVPMGVTVATIAGILYYRHKKGLATRAHNSFDNVPDINIDIRRGSTISQHNNSNREIDIVECSSNQQDNLYRGENIVINAVSDDTQIQDCPPAYEEVARSSSDPQYNFNREADITMSNSKGVTPPRIFAPTYENDIKDIKR